jgi:deoxyribodipyrimidine photo-lyase
MLARLRAQPAQVSGNLGKGARCATIRISRNHCVVPAAGAAAAMSAAAAAAAAAGEGSARPRRRIVLWFRNDLRLRDNAIIHAAVQKLAAAEFDEVLPVYCYDPRFFAASPLGLSKTGPHRAAFLQQCVADLRGSLQALGSDLLVSCGRPEEVIGAALGGCAEGGGLVLTQAEVTSEELAVDAAARRAIKVCLLCADGGW